MNRRILYSVLIAINLLVIAFFLIQYASATYPLVGHDYRLFLPRLIDSHLYYKVNGFGIEWYTPSFGGGLPAYPNPLQMQFSLQQLLTWFFNPWIAVLLSAAIYSAVGFVVAFLLLRRLLELKPLPSILGAGFFVANGFVIEQVIVGHADKITFPLVVLLVFALLHPKLPRWLAGALTALPVVILLHSGGVYIGVIGLFTLLVTLPVVYFLKPSLFSWRRILPAALWGGLFLLLLGGSKLYAIAAYMTSFPRSVHDQYFVSWQSSLVGMIFQLIGVMTSLPFLQLIGKNALTFVVRLTQWTGSPYGFWELDASISPVLTLLLACGLFKFLFRKPRFHTGSAAEGRFAPAGSRPERGAAAGTGTFGGTFSGTFGKTNLVKKIIAGVCLIAAAVLIFQFSSARGGLYSFLQGLPLFESLRTTTRFVTAFILPLAILGAKVFDTWLEGKSARTANLSFALLNGISLAALWTYYLLPMSVQERYFDTGVILDTYAQIQQGQTFPVEKIIPAMNDYEVFEAQASNVTHHYDPLLGENSFRPLVHEGSVFDIQAGYYNMTDPTGYVFPRENGSELFSRIPVSDYDKLVDFLNRRHVDWKLPWVQVALDWASGLTFILLVCAIIFYLARRRFPRLRRWLRPPAAM